MAVRIVEVKKKSSDAQRTAADSLTGMSYQTKRHFLDVKQKMIDYVAQQQGLDYDQMDLHREKPLFDLLMLDGQKAPPPPSSPHTSKSSSSTRSSKSTSKSQGHKKSPVKLHVTKRNT